MDEIEKEDDPNRVLPGGEREGYPVFHCVTVEGSVVGERSELDEPIERKLFRSDQARENLTQECFHCDVASPLDLDQLLQREFGRVRLFQVVPQDTLGLREQSIDRKCVLPTPERGDRIADDPFPADERGRSNHDSTRPTMNSAVMRSPSPSGATGLPTAAMTRGERR